MNTFLGDNTRVGFLHFVVWRTEITSNQEWGTPYPTFFVVGHKMTLVSNLKSDRLQPVSHLRKQILMHIIPFNSTHSKRRNENNLKSNFQCVSH